MRISLCIAFGMLLWLSAAGQSFEEGASYTPDRNFQPIEWLGTFKDSLVLLRGTIEDDGLPRSLQLEFFNSSDLKRGRKLNLQDVFASRRDFFPEAVFLLNGELTIWGSSFNKSDRSNVLKVLRLRPDSLPEQKTGKVNSDAEEMLSWPAAYFTNNSRRFEWAQSESGQYLCAMSVESITARNQLRIRFQVWDAWLNVVARYDARIPTELERFSVKKVGLDNTGRPFLLLEWYSNPRSHSFYAGYAFQRKDAQPLMFDFDLPGKQETDIHWVYGADNSITFCGLYGKAAGESKMEAEGLFFSLINPAGPESILTEKIAFYGLKDSIEYLRQGKETYDVLFENARILRFLPATNGYYLWLEQQSQEEICQTDFRSNMMVCNTHYFHNAVIFLELNASGELVKSNVLEKRQTLVENDEVFISGLVGGAGQELLFNRGLGEQGRLSDALRSKLALWNAFSGKVAEFDNAEPMVRSVGSFQLNGSTYVLSEGRSQARLIRVQ